MKQPTHKVLATGDDSVDVMIDCGNGLFAGVFIDVQNGVPIIAVRDVPKEVSSGALITLNERSLS